MINVVVEREKIENSMALDALVRALPGNVCCGFSQGDTGIVVHLEIDAPDAELEAMARQVVLNFVDTVPEEKVSMPAYADDMIETREGTVSIEGLLRRIKALEEERTGI